jgi:hypothetical protein
MQSSIPFFRRTPSFGGCVNSIAHIQCRRGYRLLSPRQIIAPIFVTLLAPILFAQSIAVGPITVDAISPYLDPAPSSFQPGSARSSDGHTIGLNQRYLTLDGKPWLPVMGEFHFSRVPADDPQISEPCAAAAHPLMRSCSDHLARISGEDLPVSDRCCCSPGPAQC